ncbi:hypothetical protein WAI453_004005 [Rhynchosporium graminicola]
MRLINASILALHDFFGADIPHYAILSHRTETDEVTFETFEMARISNDSMEQRLWMLCTSGFWPPETTLSVSLDVVISFHVYATY